MAFSTPDEGRRRSPSSDQTLDQNGHGAARSRNAHDVDAEKGPQDDQDSPPQPVHFFHGSLKGVRRQVLLGWARTTLILSVFILAVLSIYWAVQFRVNQNMPSLQVYVVDFDGKVTPYDTGQPSLVGPAITKAAEMMGKSSQPHLGWTSVPPSMFNNDPIEVRQSIYNYDAWAAVIVNANATALLRQAIAEGNASYDPLGAAQVVYVEARDETTMANYVVPMLNKLQTEATAAFGMMWTPMVMMNASDPAALRNIEKVPQALNPAVGFSVFNLRPFSPPTATPSITIGLICRFPAETPVERHANDGRDLIIISFFSFSFYLPIHMKFIEPKEHPLLHFPQLIAWRWVATVTAYLFLSLAYTLISLAFQIPFSKPALPATEPASTTNATNFHRASFVVYWMLNYVGMIALGLACENVAMSVGQPWVALWLIFWVITNMSTAFYEIALSPRFYYWGYAWPLHNIVEASRTIIFNVHSRLGLNFGVLFAWAAVNTAVFPFACYVMRWKAQRAKRKEAEE
ncbi:MAG: hypothetical protein M1832_000533 [Thelocarpon impressellum]|nr:MAG: hypothetical protein M1832_000533 [Thelocarpon impressellum]